MVKFILKRLIKKITYWWKLSFRYTSWTILHASPLRSSGILMRIRRRNQTGLSRKKTWATNWETYSKVITKDTAYLMMVCLQLQVIKKYFLKFEYTIKIKTCCLWSRLSKLPSNLGGGYVNAGSETNEQLIVWIFKIKFNKKWNHYNAVANDSLPINYFS
jgi:hypothetical protein